MLAWSFMDIHRAAKHMSARREFSQLRVNKAASAFLFQPILESVLFMARVVLCFCTFVLCLGGFCLERP